MGALFFIQSSASVLHFTDIPLYLEAKSIKKGNIE